MKNYEKCTFMELILNWWVRTQKCIAGPFSAGREFFLENTYFNIHTKKKTEHYSKPLS